MIDIESILPLDMTDRRRIGAVMQAALNAADPGVCVRQFLRREGGVLLAGSQSYNLRDYERVILIGAGKASFAMALAAADLLKDRKLEGAVIVKHRPEMTGRLERRGVAILVGNHPTPGEKSLLASEKVIHYARAAGENDLIIFALSGGASSLLTAPCEGISLTDLQTLTGRLLACGADIGEINSIRKHLDIVKGGGLAKLAWPAGMIVLALSDVIGSPPDVIGSGPASPDQTTYSDAWQVLEKYDLVEAAPAGIITALRDGMAGLMPETLRFDDPLFKKVNYILVGSNVQSVDAARKTAEKLGFETGGLTTGLRGEASEVGRNLAGELLRRLEAGGEPFCLLTGGETTVTLKGSGLGGRNLELALGAVEVLDGIPGVVFVSLASDGDDGNSGAAGAVVTGESMPKAKRLGLVPAAYMKNNDSFHFFERAGGLLVTGPTGTNVNDLVFLFGNLPEQL